MVQTLEEIFKDKPELLNEFPIINLVKYVQEQHRDMANRLKAEKALAANILELCYNSECAVISGMDAKETINTILEIFDN
jgi:hypothetical protein